jgi:predicted permease
MSFFDALRHRLHVLRRGEEYADEQAREFAFHLELAEREQLGTEADRGVAERAARRQLGSLTRYRELAREMSLLAWLDRLRQDLGYAWRGLRREPAFTVMVMVTLGLGVGLNAAVFSLLDRLFVRPPAGLESSKELRRLYVETELINGLKPVYEEVPSRVYAHMSAVLNSQQISAYSSGDSVGIETPTEYPAKLSSVSANFFSILGVPFRLGRSFTAEEERLDQAKSVVVISDALWRRVFRRDPSVVGRTMRIDGETFTVIGVAGSRFTGVDLDRVDLWVPLGLLSRKQSAAAWYTTFAFDALKVLVRVPGGIVQPQIEAAITARLRADAAIHMGIYDKGVTATLDGPIAEAAGPMSADAETAVALRIASVVLIVLLIACANVTNLLILRGVRHSREIAVRRALGVSRARLGAQVLLESLLLTALGCIVAMAVAFGGGTLLRRLLFPSIRWSGGVLDLRTLACLAAIAVIAGVIAGIAPALAAANPNLMVLLRRGAQDGSRGAAARSALVVLQTSLCVTLLVGATLFTRSLLNAKAIRVGYDTRGLMFAGVVVGARSDTIRGIVGATELERIVNDMRTFPGVISTAITSQRPLGSTIMPVRPSSYGKPQLRLPLRGGPITASVTRDYFTTAGIPVIAGRTFTDQDFAIASSTASPVEIVSRRRAGALWPDESWRDLCSSRLSATRCRKVVGVVEDTHASRIVEDPIGQSYMPWVADFSRAPDNLAYYGYILVRAAPASLGPVASELRRRLIHLVRQQRRVRVTTLAQVLEPELRPWVVSAQLFTAVAILALIVAVVGVFSVTSYAMSQRTHEIGVRLAFGARRNDIVRLAALRGLTTLLIGVALGSFTAVILGRFVASQLLGVKANDVPTLVGADLSLLAVGMLSGLLPAWRASRIDPARTLAAE